MPNYKAVDADRLDADLAAVAETIRAKSNTSEPLEFPGGFQNAVDAIQTGGKLQSKTVSPSYSEQTVVADEDYYGLESVTVKAVPKVKACEVEKVVDIAVSIVGENPEGELQYIRSDGYQYFDTGVVPDGNTEIEMKYSVQNILSLGNHMLSAKGFYFPFPRSYGGVNHFFVSRFGNEARIDFSPTVDEEYTIRAFPSSKITINGQECATLEAGSSSVTDTLYMNTYGGSPGNSNYTGSAKIFYCKIWKNGELIRDFIPYRSSKAEVGMLDRVDNKMYTSIATVEFLAGPKAQSG